MSLVLVVFKEIRQEKKRSLPTSKTDYSLISTELPLDKVALLIETKIKEKLGKGWTVFVHVNNHQDDVCGDAVLSSLAGVGLFPKIEVDVVLVK